MGGRGESHGRYVASLVALLKQALTLFGNSSLKWPVIPEEPERIPGLPQQGGVLITVRVYCLGFLNLSCSPQPVQDWVLLFLPQNSTRPLHSPRSRPKPSCIASTYSLCNGMQSASLKSSDNINSPEGFSWVLLKLLFTPKNNSQIAQRLLRSGQGIPQVALKFLSHVQREDYFLFLAGFYRTHWPVF